MKVVIDRNNKIVYRQVPDFEEGMGITNAIRINGGNESDYSEIEITDDDYKRMTYDYRAERKAAYPDIAEYIDAQVKKASDNPEIKNQGVLQEQEYFRKCLEVKSKFPKEL